MTSTTTTRGGIAALAPTAELGGAMTQLGTGTGARTPTAIAATPPPASATRPARRR